ncbi:glycoside hydrolase domain-containing protein [Microbacterium sp. GXF0217]
MVIDLQIQASQFWLNSTYGAESQWVDVPTNGQTGWPTIFGLTRALQIELGITTLSDTFGPTTEATFVQEFGTLNPTTTDQNANVVRILQGALWCKGYSGGWDPGVYDNDVMDSVSRINSHLGLSPSIVSVNVKLMKSLLTMDAYVRVGSGTPEKREAQQWLNGHYSHRRDFPLLPCDGLFSRSTQRGLMFAIQYELNMDDGVANGNFGPGTRSGLQSSAYVSNGDTDGSKNWVRLFQAALRFNGYAASFSGAFDAATATAATTFQGYAELQASGSGDYQTWASLLVSTGDATRPGIASDMMTQLTAEHCALLYEKGYRTVGRYISVLGKRYAPGELERIFAAGLKTFPIMQEANTSVSDFSYAKGLDHGFQALRRLRQLGFKPNTTVFFAVDLDALDDQITASVIPYFQGVSDYIHSTAVDYRVGIYGTRNVCARVINSGLASEGFIASMSWGWSGNLGFSLPPSWSYDQIQNYTLTGSNASLEIDKNIQSSRAHPVGQTDMNPTALVPQPPLADLQFDEPYLWYLVELDVRAEHLEGQANIFTRDNVLRFIQRQEANYTAGIWDVYTPAVEADPLLNLNQLMVAEKTARRGQFESVSPQAAAYRKSLLTHFSATLRGYLRWGQIEPANFLARTGDLAGWAGDLVNAWNEYYKSYRTDPSWTISEWFAAHVGGTHADSRFSAEDLRADVDAFLCYKLLGDAPNRSISDCVREIEWNSSSSPTWRYSQFAAQRFDGSHAVAQVAAKSIFDGGWPWVDVSLASFLETGVVGPTDAEAAEVGAGFADALFSKF